MEISGEYDVVFVREDHPVLMIQITWFHFLPLPSIQTRNYLMDSHRISKSRGVTPLVATLVINVRFSNYSKRLDIIFLYRPGLMISIDDDQILLQSDLTALVKFAIQH